MPTLLTDAESIVAAMKQRIASPTPASIAIAFWGLGACKELGLDAAAPGTRVLLNADSGACNPKELERLLDLDNVHVKNSSRLHAKVVIAGNRVVVGSANASANGLGFEGQLGWDEACVELDDASIRSEANLWFDSKWTRATEDLSRETICRAERAFRRLKAHAAALRRASRDPGTVATLADLREGVFVVVTDEDSDFTQQQRAGMGATLGITASDRVDYYQDWRAIPQNSLLIAFGGDPKSLKVEFDGYWISSDGRSVKVPGAGRGYPVTSATKGELKDWGLTGNLRWDSSVSAVVELFNDRRGLGKRLRKESAGRIQYSGPTDWCMPLADMLLLCAEHGKPVPDPWRAEVSSFWPVANKRR